MCCICGLQLDGNQHPHGVAAQSCTHNKVLAGCELPLPRAICTTRQTAVVLISQLLIPACRRNMATERVGKPSEVWGSGFPQVPYSEGCSLSQECRLTQAASAGAC